MMIASIHTRLCFKPSSPRPNRPLPSHITRLFLSQHIALQLQLRNISPTPFPQWIVLPGLFPALTLVLFKQTDHELEDLPDPLRLVLAFLASALTLFLIRCFVNCKLVHDISDCWIKLQMRMDRYMADQNDGVQLTDDDDVPVEDVYRSSVMVFAALPLAAIIAKTLPESVSILQWLYETSVNKLGKIDTAEFFSLVVIINMLKSG